MKVDIEINGRTRTVGVERVGTRFRLAFDGRVQTVDLARVDERTWSLIVLGDKPESHEVGLLEGVEPGELEIYLRTGVLRARLGNRAPARDQAVAGDQAARTVGAARVTTPMPGKVTRVLVAPGDRVAARQGLVVVEAMKMENELRSPKEGVVRELHVSEGMSVEAGRLLVVVE
jgi:acetyl/propionyl-CoA carboxylase alpha subunit